MMTRRGLFTGPGLSAALGWAARPKTALGAISVKHSRTSGGGEVLISVFLRGGADSLSVIVPHGDDDYYRNRPTLAIARPNDKRAAATDRVSDLDGFFGLHPALLPLKPFYEAKQMAIIHACGSGDQTRSHFEAMATIERGIFRTTGPASGWLARHLETAPWDNASPLRAVALGAMAPDALRGASSAMALRTVADVKLRVPTPNRAAAVTQTLTSLYGHNGEGKDGLLTGAGSEALSVLQTLNALAPSQYKPAANAVYPEDAFGEGLRQVALLMKSDVGLETACLDHAGYDTHVAQGTTQGVLAGRLKSLATGLAAFIADIGAERWAKTTIIVQSEFGRRVEENSGAGTDHGRAGAMLALGGGRGLAGGRAHGVWPGLAADHLEGPGDLRVTTDYRNVLAEVVKNRLGNPNVAAVFPGLSLQPVGVTTAAAATVHA